MLLKLTFKHYQSKKQNYNNHLRWVFLFSLLIMALGVRAQTKETNPIYLKKNYGTWKTHKSSHFKIYYRNSDKFFAKTLDKDEIEEISTLQENNLRRIASILNIAKEKTDTLRPINMWLFRNSKIKTEITKIPADAFSIYPFWSMYYTYKSAKSAHELAHLIIQEYWGYFESKKYNFLISEGFASLVDEGYGKRDFDYYEKAESILDRDKYSMDVVINNKPVTGFFQNSYTQKAVVAGAFVKYLIEEYDIRKFKQLWQTLRNDSKTFKKVYNKSLDNLCLDFKSYIND